MSNHIGDVVYAQDKEEGLVLSTFSDNPKVWDQVIYLCPTSQKNLYEKLKEKLNAESIKNH